MKRRPVVLAVALFGLITTALAIQGVAPWAILGVTGTSTAFYLLGVMDGAADRRRDSVTRVLTILMHEDEL